MEYIVHYIYEDREYSELKPMSENQYKRIIKAKTIRTKSTGPNHHLEQCATVPKKGIDKVYMEGVRLEPCYKKFTGIIPKSRKRKSIFAKQNPRDC